MLRHGFLGELCLYGTGPQVDKTVYHAYGLRVVRDKDGNTVFDSLSKGTCPVCSSTLQVVNVRETTSSKFAGTFEDNIEIAHAVGTLACVASERHLAAYSWEWTTVLLNGTVNSLIPKLSEIADELGW
ncbi:MAG: hypothetical protein E6R04_02935 [Spirochaetes bacterium]|nr:MAG: hypothetical protein E6R04_02935 [Spirochaetota bacterium]